MVKIAFFQLEKWEKEYMQAHLKNHELLFFDDIVNDCLNKIKDVEVIAIFVFSRITKDVLEKLPNLKLITTMSTGFDHIDVSECKKRKIETCYVPAYGSNTVAEHAMALLLAIYKKLIPSIEQTRAGGFSREGLQGFDLQGKTIGIIGTGKIGLHLAKYAKAFDMRVIAFDKFPNKDHAKEIGFEYKEFDTVLAESDVLSLHLPEMPETHHIINKKNISQIKKGCVLINTARGGLVETEAILEGLEKGIFSACGLDVLEEECTIREEKELLHETYKKTREMETVLADHALMKHEQVLVTPHNAFHTKEALQRILDTTIENIKSFFASVPKNIIPSK